MYVVDASILVPLISSMGRHLIDIVLKSRFHILDLTPYEVCNAFWKECIKLCRIDMFKAVHACRIVYDLDEFLKIIGGSIG